MIVETDASEIGYGVILKQKISKSTKEYIFCFHSGHNLTDIYSAL